MRQPRTAMGLHGVIIQNITVKVGLIYDIILWENHHRMILSRVIGDTSVIGDKQKQRVLERTIAYFPFIVI
jgi:hypothetical protein